MLMMRTPGSASAASRDGSIRRKRGTKSCDDPRRGRSRAPSQQAAEALNASGVVGGHDRWRARSSTCRRRRRAARSPSPLRACPLELLAHEFVVDRSLDGSEDAERDGSVRLKRDPREREREAGLRAPSRERGESLRRPRRDDHAASRPRAARRPSRPDTDGLAMARGRCGSPSRRARSRTPRRCRCCSSGGSRRTRSHGAGSGVEDFGEPLLVGVDRPSDEGRLGADRNRERIERVVERAHRRRLRHLPELRRRRVLALRQPIDPVVEEEDLEVDVAPKRVDQVVAADRERIAVSVTTQTERSGRVTARPVAIAGRARGSSASRTSACSRGGAPHSRSRRRRRGARGGSRARA